MLKVRPHTMGDHTVEGLPAYPEKDSVIHKSRSQKSAEQASGTLTVCDPVHSYSCKG